jgi:hypothetical protein
MGAGGAGCLWAPAGFPPPLFFRRQAAARCRRDRTISPIAAAFGSAGGKDAAAITDVLDRIAIRAFNYRSSIDNPRPEGAMEGSTGMTAGILLLWVAVVGVIVVAIFVVRLVRQLTRAGAELEQLTHSLNNSLLPRVERLLDKTEAEMAEVRAISLSVQRMADTADQVLGTVGDIVVRARDSVEPVFSAVGTIGKPIRQGAAIWTGVKAGMGVLRRVRNDGSAR